MNGHVVAHPAASTLVRGDAVVGAVGFPNCRRPNIDALISDSRAGGATLACNIYLRVLGHDFLQLLLQKAIEGLELMRDQARRCEPAHEELLEASAGDLMHRFAGALAAPQVSLYVRRRSV